MRVDPRSRTIWNNLHDLDQDLRIWGGVYAKNRKKAKKTGLQVKLNSFTKFRRKNGLKLDILDILIFWTFHMTWYLGRTPMWNDRELSCIERVKLVQTSNTCVLLHCRICLYQAQILIQKINWISQKHHIYQL